MIRRLTPDDADAFFRVRLNGLETHPEAFGTGADAWRAGPLDQVRASLETVESAPKRFVLGAFDGGELVGVLGFRREGRVSLRHKGSLWGFFVHADHRRRGLGSGLLRAALDAAAACEGLRYLRVVVTMANEEAVRRFESHRFVRYGLEVGGLRVGDVSYDQAFMRCELGNSRGDRDGDG